MKGNLVQDSDGLHQILDLVGLRTVGTVGLQFFELANHFGSPCHQLYLRQVLFGLVVQSGYSCDVWVFPFRLTKNFESAGE